MTIIDLQLSGSAYGGEAFGRDEDGRMTFVAFALPGETVRVEIVDARKSWARARLVEVLEASPERIDPRCPHFTECGGCHYQHAPYDTQLKIKAGILRDQLVRIGGFEAPPTRSIVPSPSPWNTRNQLQFSLADDGRLGFMAASTNDVVPIRECHLPLPEIDEVWPRIDAAERFDLERIILRTGTDGEVLIALQSELEPELDISIDLPASLVWLGPQGVTVIAGNEYLAYDVLDQRFRVSARSFFQVNSLLLDELVRLVLRAIDPKPGETIFDLYAGAGLFSAFIARHGARLVAVEQSLWSCRDFEVNLRAFDDVALYEAPVEMALPSIQEKPDMILVDPPRDGLSREVRDTLIELAPAKLVYLSCDPSTLARDAKRLVQAGCKLESVTPIDLFPQTYHLESLAVFEFSKN
jgi:23S rRNA (uracil1939-C5)-methyltransferase